MTFYRCDFCNTTEQVFRDAVNVVLASNEARNFDACQPCMAKLLQLAREKGFSCPATATSA